MDLTFVAAILSVVGYSLNDSIVVFDRVRENFRKIRRIETIEVVDIINSNTCTNVNDICHYSICGYCSLCFWWAFNQ